MDLSVFSWDNFLVWILGFSLLALIIERSLYQIFDSKIWNHLENYIDNLIGNDCLDIKPWISVGACIFLTWSLDLDMIAFMFQKQPLYFSKILTGLFLSGGSTGIYKYLKRVRKLKEVMTEKKEKE